jgi:hypothetical protein
MARERDDPAVLDALVSELGDLIVETAGGSLGTGPREGPSPAADSSLSVIRAADEVTRLANRGRARGDATRARNSVEAAKRAVRAARGALRAAASAGKLVPAEQGEK